MLSRHDRFTNHEFAHATQAVARRSSPACADPAAWQVGPSLARRCIMSSRTGTVTATIELRVEVLGALIGHCGARPGPQTAALSLLSTAGQVLKSLACTAATCTATVPAIPPRPPALSSMRPPSPRRPRGPDRRRARHPSWSKLLMFRARPAPRHGVSGGPRYGPPKRLGEPPGVTDSRYKWATCSLLSGRNHDHTEPS
jgi:hypothetical protein